MQSAFGGNAFVSMTPPVTAKNIRIPLKKTYLLTIEGKNRDRLLDAAKHDIRKYVKRERSRPLPPGVDFFDFDCKLGGSETTSETLHFATLMASIDTLLKDGADQFYVEVVTTHGHRSARPQSADGAEKPATDSD